jgi:metal-dependent hydrolase (beta-lactamase superfamily II)
MRNATESVTETMVAHRHNDHTHGMVKGDNICFE